MAPLVEAFPPSQLAQRVQTKLNDRTQKPQINLRECELKEMVQYSCNLDGPKEDPRSKIVCEPVLRMFRKCANGLTVETTAWEGVHDR